MQETQETWVWSLGREDPLEEGMATHCSILAWRIPWTEESGRLQSLRSQNVGQDWSDSTEHSTDKGEDADRFLGQVENHPPSCLHSLCGVLRGRSPREAAWDTERQVRERVGCKRSSEVQQSKVGCFLSYGHVSPLKVTPVVLEKRVLVDSCHRTLWAPLKIRGGSKRAAGGSAMWA